MTAALYVLIIVVLALSVWVARLDTVVRWLRAREQERIVEEAERLRRRGL